jgi:apolipoprotein N-acyltransferase
VSRPLAADLAAALVLGAAHCLPFVHTEAWWLQLATLALFVALLRGAAPGRAALAGLAFGTAWLAAGVWWLFISMHRYGGLPAWMAALAVAALCAALSLYLAAASAAFARWRPARAGLAAPMFAALWLLAELARGTLLTGFPWVASGYAHVDGPLAALAPWSGVYGIGFAAALIAAWAGLGAWRSVRGALAAMLLPILLLGATAGLGAREFTRPTGTLSVTLLQSNVPQDEKFSLAYLPEALGWAATQLVAARGELVMAPETVIPLLPAQLEPGYWDALLAHFRSGNRAALVGLPLGDERSGYTNSAAGISAASAALPGGFYRYDKHHLVPFGEFIPSGFRWFVDMMDIPLGDFARGPLAAPSFEHRGERIAPNICYEDLFGEELAARFVDADSAPTMLANLSNIGWFGDTIAIPQHLHISRMRSLELQRPMLRATNTGATAAIDHRGRVQAWIAPQTRGALEARVQGRSGRTPFATWASRFGLWPLAILAAVLAFGLARRRASRSDP